MGSGRKVKVVLAVVLAAALVAAVGTLSVRAPRAGRDATAGVGSGAKPTSPVIQDASADITPAAEDFPKEIAESKHVRLALARGGRLRALGPTPTPADVLGGGRGGGPGGDPGMPDQDPLVYWYSSTRYILYVSPEAARRDAFNEDALRRALRPRRGSFSGTRIGDLCGYISQPDIGHFELHVVRANASVTIEAWVAPEWVGADPAVIRSARQDLQSIVQKALEATATIIAKRIDAVVRAKGKVEMSNLPPVAPPTGPMNAN